jgi:hypothetical protein
MKSTDLKVSIYKDGSKVACNPKATPFLIDIFRSHTKSKFTLILNAGADDGTPYDEFSLGGDFSPPLLTGARSELLSRLCSRVSEN